MHWLEIVLLFLGFQSETCISTIFGTPRDKHAGGNAVFLKRPVDDQDIGIAHRTLPLGKPIIVFNRRTRQASHGIILDRGPYGAMHEGKWFVKKYKHQPGTYRGCADLTPRLARRVGHDSWDKVTLYWRRDRKGKR